MKVRAKWTVKDGSGWHRAGEVFEVEDIRKYAGSVEPVEPDRPAANGGNAENADNPAAAEHEKPAKKTRSRAKKKE